MLSLSFLRPEYLLLTPLLLVLLINQQKRESSAWSQLLSPSIAKYLLDKPGSNKRSQWHLAALLSLIILSLSGPSIVTDNIPLYRDGSARVLLMDMSYSMRARDVKPDRVELAKFKALDLLQQWQDGETALIAFAGDAFVLSPLSRDSNTLANLVPHLKPELMPVHGSDLPLALNKAAELIQQAGYAQGDVVVIGDGLNQAQLQQSLSILKQQHLRFSMLAVGTEQGAPIPLNDGSMLKDQHGSIVIPKTKIEDFLPLCQQTGGICQFISADNRDIEALASLRNQDANAQQSASEQTQGRKDIGYLLLPVIMLLLLFKLRRGDLLLVSLLFTALVTPTPSFAIELWKNQAQQAQQAFEQGDYQQAADKFRDPQWQAAALYKAGQYQQAQQLFAQDQSATGWFNQGNALAQMGKYQAAIDAYQHALDLQPEFPEAAANKTLIEQLLQQQQQQQDSAQSEASQQQASESQSEQQAEQPPEQQAQDSAQQPSEPQQTSSAEQDAEQKRQQAQAEQDAAQQQAEQERQQAQAESNAEQQQTETSEAQQANPQNTQDQETPEQKELQQWLDTLPNDPSLLLRNKMYLEYQKRRRQPSNNQENW